MPKTFYVVLAILFCSFTYGQNTFNLKGKVIDEVTKLPIESATVYLSSAKDSTVIDYTITDKFGKFDFKLKKIDKPVFLKISFVTYDEYKIPLENVSADKDFGTLALKVAINNLDEVIIKKETPPIRIKKTL